MVTVEELLSNTKVGENAFRIPDYQRGYAWSADHEFKDLWNDILRVYETGDKEKKHYTGMLALEEMGDKAKEHELLIGCNAFYIVDGQQRLTSIIIILQSLINYLKEEETNSVPADLLSFDGDSYRFDYSVDRKDGSSEFFRNRIYKSEKGVQYDDIYLKNINDAKEFVDERLLKFDASEAERLLEVILNQLVFNIYFIVDGFDVRVTFETMNNRGKKLSNFELLKNRLMYLSTFIREEASSSSNYEGRLKKRINEVWKNVYENLSYGTGQYSDDEYLQAHWIVYGCLDKSKGDSYIKDILGDFFSIDNGKFHDLVAKKDFKGCYNHIIEYIESLDKYSRFWSLIKDPSKKPAADVSKNEKLLLGRLSRIASTKFVRPTVMVVAGDKHLKDEQKCEFYEALERSLFLNKVIGQSKNDYSSIIKSARDLLHGEGGGFEALLSSLRSGELAVDEGRIRSCFERFGAVMKDKDGFFYSWSGINYFLYEYNESLQIKQGEKAVVWDEVSAESIEHILPQTPSREYWRIVLSPIAFDEAKIRRLTNSLGNLLLLSKGENSSVSNFSFPIKKKIDVDANKFAYIYGSRSAQKVAENERWTLEEIKKREDDLFEFMYAHWVAPLKDAGLSEDEFMDMIVSDGLSIGMQNPLPESDIARLDSLKFDDEKPFVKERKADNDKAWFDDLSRFFDESRCYVWLNNKKLVYKDKCFVFRKRSNVIYCGTKCGEDCYRFTYGLDSGALKVEKNWSPIFDQPNFDGCVLYFIKTFNRYVKRCLHKPEAVIYKEPTSIEENGDDDTKNDAEEVPQADSAAQKS